MEHRKITNLLGDSGDQPRKYQSEKWIEINDDSRGTYSTDSQIKFKTTTTMSDLCDFSEAYILVEGTVTAMNTADPPVANNAAEVAFKNCAPFTSCISEINNTQIDNAKDLDITMPMYNVLEYSKNYAEDTGSLYNFKRDVGGAVAGGIDDRVVGTTNAQGTLATKIVVPLKYLSNFWRTLEMPLINTEINLMLTWSANCVLGLANNGTRTFAITKTRLYVPVVTLSASDNSKFLQQLKSGFKRSVFWNEYLTKQDNVVAANRNYDFLIDPSFQGPNRLFVLPFSLPAAGTADPRLGTGYYLPSENVTHYNVLINGKTFLDKPITEDTRKYNDLRKLTIGGGDDYTVGSLLDFKYVRDTYKVLGIDLSKQEELDADPRAIQQVNFTAHVPANTAMFYILEKSKETVLDFSQGTVRVM